MTLVACSSSPAVPADSALVSDVGDAPADAPTPDAQLPAPVFAFDYAQRTPTAVQLDAVATWGADTQLVTGEAGATFTTDDRWTTSLRRASPELELFGVAALDDTHLIAVGEGGAIAVGSGRGATWTSCASPTTSVLRAVAITAHEGVVVRIVAVGEGGEIVRGSVMLDANVTCGTFAAVDGTTPYTLRAVAHDPITGVTLAGGRDVLRSTDGGASWTHVARPTAYTGTSGAVNALLALPEGGFLVGAGPTAPPGSPGASGLLASADGTAFTELPGFTTIQVYALATAGPHRAWAAGTRISVTTGGTSQGGARISLARDDGVGWGEVEQAVPDEAASLVRAHAIAAAGADHAVWVGQAGTIVATDDRGATWSVRTRGSRATFTAVTQDVATTAWAIARSGEALVTSDAGQTWTEERALDPGTDLYGIAATPTRVFAVGDGGTIVRRSAGSWSLEPSVTTQQLLRVRCIDAARCYAAGRQQTLLAWDGTSWSMVPEVAGPATFAGLAVYTHAGLTRGVVMGTSGVVATLEVGTWTLRAPVTGVSFVGVALAPDGSGRGLAVAIDDATQAPLVYASVDHGVTWMPAPAPQLDAARTVAYDASTGAWFIGGLVTLWRSSDDGATWQALRPGVARLPMNGLSVDDGHVFVVGNGGLVVHSASGGL